MSGSYTDGKTVDVNTLIMALFFMMTQYAHNQDQNLIQPILDHFNWLENHPEIANSQLQKTSTKLKRSWYLLSDAKIPCCHCNPLLH